MWTERAERRQQLAAQKSSDSKQRHIHVQVLVIVCRDFFHSVLLSVVLRLLEAYHISLVNKVLPINSNVIPNHENREIWQKYTSTVITCVFFCESKHRACKAHIQAWSKSEEDELEAWLKFPNLPNLVFTGTNLSADC